MASPVTLPIITFTEYAQGTRDPIYSFAGVVNGRTFNMFTSGEVVPDGCNPTSPGFAANASYSGPVVLRFSKAISGISFDAGCFDNLKSTRVTIFGPKDYKITKTLNQTDQAIYENFSFDFGENVIRKVVIRPIGTEKAGFAIDNVKITLRPEHASVTATKDTRIDSLLWGTKWAEQTVTWSFMTAKSKMPAYGDGPETFPTSAVRKTTMEPLSAGQKAMARAAMDLIDDVAGIVFSQTPDTAGAPGTIRFARGAIDAPADGNLPGHFAKAGDIFINTTRPTDEARPGSYDYYVFVHEIGHALGLKHPHESSGPIGTALPAGRDSHEFSVMSYRSYPGQSVTNVTNAPGSFPHTLMMYDIAALQHLYGANYSTRSGDTVYSFSPSKARIFETIWDGGGNDTFDASRYSVKVSIDLRPGKWSVLDPSQLAKLGNDGTKDIFARGNVFNALLYNDDPRSLIENAVGGSKGDRITGNRADNNLRGLAGNDTLDGLGGNDLLIGGSGTDKVLGGSGADSLYGGRGNDDINGDLGRDLILGGRGDDTIAGHAGRDTLTGDRGQDRISGGDGADRFVFHRIADSPAGVGRRDTIVDFTPGTDSIDLRSVDADATAAGRQGWSFIGNAAFSGTPGELRYLKGAGFGLLQGDADGDSVADFAIRLEGPVDLTLADLLL